MHCRVSSLSYTRSVETICLLLSAYSYAAHMQVSVFAANMWVTIFIVIMQMGISFAIMQVVFSAVHYPQDFVYCNYAGNSCIAM